MKLMENAKAYCWQKMHTAVQCWGYSETVRKADRLKQLSEWLFVAPRVLRFGEIINCIIRTPVIHKFFVPATV